MWIVPAVYPMLSALCLMVEQEKLSLGFHSMLTRRPQLQDKEYWPFFLVIHHR